MLVAAIPSPSVNTFDLGPLTIHYYGIMLGLGVALGSTIIARRYARRAGTAFPVDRVILWMVVIGFVGARLAYVSTHTARYAGRWHAVLFIWEGGIALFGGLTAGAITILVLMRRWGGDLWAFLDAAAVGVPVAQAIGRWGNYFNQELFGTPTGLPWGLEIDPVNRPAKYLDAATFHPTFLYESLFIALILVPLILWLERRERLAKGTAIGLYFALYGSIRFLTELLRTDTTYRLLGLSRNAWVALAVVIGGAVIVVRRQRRGEHYAVDGDPVMAP